jgi:hypothetical protein
VRHRFVTVLGLAVCAVIAGARSYVAIAEWATDADPATLAELGAGQAVAIEDDVLGALDENQRETLHNLLLQAARGTETSCPTAIDA